MTSIHAIDRLRFDAPPHNLHQHGISNPGLNRAEDAKGAAKSLV